MPHIDLAAAPVGAATPPTVVDGRPPVAAGFADALADAQTATGDGGTAADVEPEPVEPGGPRGTKGDVRLTRWLALSRLAPQLATGEAAVLHALPAGWPPLRMPPLDTPVPATEATPASDEPGSSGQMPVLPVLAAGMLTLTITGPAPTGPEPDDRPGGGVSGAADGMKPVPPDDPSGAELGNAVQTIHSSWPEPPLEPEDVVTTPVTPGLPEAATSGPGVVTASAHGQQPQTPAPAAPPPELRPSEAAAATPAPERPADGPHRLPAHAVIDAPPAGASEGRQDVDDKPTKAARLQSGFARTVAARFKANEPAEMAVAAPPRALPDVVDTPRPGGRGPRETPVALPVTVVAPMPGPLGAVGRPLAVAAPSGGVPMEAGGGADLESQIVQAMRVQWTGTGGDARIRLQPHYLGELTISLKVEHGAVIAHLTASAPDVRQWIEANEATLRQGLAQHDLKLERLVVADDEPAAGSGDEPDTAGHEAQQQPRPRRRRAETDATFEVVV